MRLATCRSAFTGIAQKDLGTIILYRGVGNIAAIKAERWRLFSDLSRRGSARRCAWGTST